MDQSQRQKGSSTSKTNNVEKSQNCHQYELQSLKEVDLRITTGKKSNKCNQCDFLCSHAGNLKRNMKTHSGEKSDKCNQCDYASS